MDTILEGVVAGVTAGATILVGVKLFLRSQGGLQNLVRTITNIADSEVE